MNKSCWKWQASGVLHLHIRQTLLSCVQAIHFLSVYVLWELNLWPLSCWRNANKATGSLCVALHRSLLIAFLCSLMPLPLFSIASPFTSVCLFGLSGALVCVRWGRLYLIVVIVLSCFVGAGARPPPCNALDHPSSLYCRVPPTVISIFIIAQRS